MSVDDNRRVCERASTPARQPARAAMAAAGRDRGRRGEMDARITGVAQHRAGDGYEPRDGRHRQWYHHLSPIWALVRSGCWSLLSSGGAAPAILAPGSSAGGPRASATSATKSKTAHLPPAAIPTLEQHTPAARQHTLPHPPPMSSGPSPGLRPLGTPACYPPMHAIFAPAASLMHHDAPPNELQRFAPSSQATRFAPWLRRKVERERRRRRNARLTTCYACP
jgi:hypothetical protein